MTFLVKKKMLLKKKDELKCRRMPWRIFHEHSDYNRADSFLAWRATETDNTFSGRAREMLLRTQEFLTIKYHRKQASKCPSTAGRGGDKWAGKSAECVPCLGKVNYAALLTHEQHRRRIVMVARTQKLGKDRLKLPFM